MRQRSRSRLWLAIAGGLMLLTTITACANKNATSSSAAKVPHLVTVTVPYAQGGGGDTFARTIAPALGKYTAGHPTVQVQNLPGGEGIPGNNKFMSDAPADGSALLLSGGSSYVPWLLGVSAVKYDFNQLQPLLLQGTGGVFYVNSSVGIQSAAQLLQAKTELKYGGISATGDDLSSLLSFDLLKLNVKTTFGFEGRGPVQLAVARGELNFDFQTTPVYNSQLAPEAASGKIVPLMTLGVLDANGQVVRDPNFPQLPTVPEVYQQLYGSAPSGPAYQAYVSVATGVNTYGKGFWFKPGTPKSIQDAYYAAVDDMTKDTAFMTKLQSTLGKYPLVRGDTVATSVKKVFTLSPDVVEYVKNLLKSKYNATV